MFPFIFSPSKVSQPLLQPCKTNITSCDENVTRDCQKVLEDTVFGVPTRLVPYYIFQYFPRKILWPLFFGSSINLFLKPRMMIFSLVFLRWPSLTSQRLLLMFWHEFCQTATKCWELMSFAIFGKVGEGVWSLYLCNCCLTALIFPSPSPPAREIFISLWQDKIHRFFFPFIAAFSSCINSVLMICCK